MTASPFTITFYRVRCDFGCIEEGVGAIFESHPGEVFPLAIPDDPRNIGISSWSLARHGAYSVDVKGSYADPLDISPGPLFRRAESHLGYLIDCGIGDEHDD